jgi:hypothetical protein
MISGGYRDDMITNVASLNSDGQQFHQYQQKEQPFLTSKH